MAEPVADKVAAQVEAVTSNPPPASVTETVTTTATATETAASPAAPAANAAQTASQSAPSVVQATAAAVTQAAAQTVSAAASTAAAAVTAAAATAASSIASAAITAASAAASGSSAASQAVIDAVSTAASQDSAPAEVQSFGELLVQLVASLEEVSTSAESVVGKDVFAVLGLGDARRGGLVLLMLLGLLFFVVVSFIVRSATRVVIPKKGHAVLLLGDTNSGKTALFFKLQQGDFRDTVPSAKENAGKFIPIGLEFEASQKSVADNLEFVDFPGHGSLRTRLAEVLPKARAIVFVVDSTVGTPVVTTPGEAPTAPFPGLHPSAEYLYSLLTNKSVVSRKIPIMIACSKVDLDNKLSSSRISSELNKMLNNMRNIKHNLADISGGASKDTVPLPMAQGQEKFVLEKNPACPVTFGEISSKDDNIREIMYFLQESLL